MSGKDADQLVELTCLPSDLEAQLLVSRLEDAGIKAQTIASAPQGMGFISPAPEPYGGVQVRVLDRDLERARVIACEFEAEGADMDAFEDDDEVDAG